MVAKSLDGTFCDDEGMIVWPLVGIPQAFLSALGEAFEAGVSNLKAADALMVGMRKDGVAVQVGINPPGEEGAGQDGGGDFPLLFEVGMGVLKGRHGGELCLDPCHVSADRLYNGRISLLKGLRGRGRGVRAQPWPKPLTGFSKPARDPV